MIIEWVDELHLTKIKEKENILKLFITRWRLPGIITKKIVYLKEKKGYGDDKQFIKMTGQQGSVWDRGDTWEEEAIREGQNDSRLRPAVTLI